MAPQMNTFAIPDVPFAFSLSLSPSLCCRMMRLCKSLEILTSLGINGLVEWTFPARPERIHFSCIFHAARDTISPLCVADARRKILREQGSR